MADYPPNRPPLFLSNPEIVDRLIEAIRAGTTIVAACQFAGIAEPTYHVWAGRGRRERERRLNGAEPNPAEEGYLQVLERLEKARGDAIVRNIGVIQKAALDGTWQAAAWWLERTLPADYSRRTIVTGANDGPVEVAVTPHDLEKKLSALLDVEEGDPAGGQEA